MDRILTFRSTRSATSVVSAFLRHLHLAQRTGTDAARLAEMPRERLEDMGITPRTDANRRTSGQRGRVPQAPLW